MGAELYVPMADGIHPVRIVDPVFHDKEGERLNV